MNMTFRPLRVIVSQLTAIRYSSNSSSILKLNELTYLPDAVKKVRILFEFLASLWSLWILSRARCGLSTKMSNTYVKDDLC